MQKEKEEPARKKKKKQGADAGDQNPCLRLFAREKKAAGLKETQHYGMNGRLIGEEGG